MNAQFRWGLVLSTLSEMSDVEHQLVVQSSRPATFVPDELITRWFEVFERGEDFINAGFTMEILSVLREFDLHLHDLINMMPGASDDKESYIRNNEAWSMIRHMADLTLIRLTLLTIPTEPLFSRN